MFGQLKWGSPISSSIKGHRSKRLDWSQRLHKKSFAKLHVTQDRKKPSTSLIAQTKKLKICWWDGQIPWLNRWRSTKWHPMLAPRWAADWDPNTQTPRLKLKLVDLWCVSLSLLEMPMLRFCLDVNVGSCEHCSWLWTSYYVDLLQGRFIELHVDPVVQYAPHHLMSAPCPDLPQRIACPQSTLLELFQEQISNMSYIPFLQTFYVSSISQSTSFFFHTFHLCPCLIFACWHWHFTTLSFQLSQVFPDISTWLSSLPCPDSKKATRGGAGRGGRGAGTKAKECERDRLSELEYWSMSKFWLN